MTAGGDAEQTVARLAREGLLDESAEDLYENAAAGLVSTLLDGTIVKVNATLLRWTGYERDELVEQKRLHDLLGPGARIYYETHYAPLLLMQGAVREIAAELIRSDGTRLPVLMNSVVVRDELGEPRVVRTSIFDASERRRYEQELLRAREDAEDRARASRALAHVAEGVVVVDEDGTVQLLNPAAEFILGVRADDVLGRRALDVLEGWESVAACARHAHGTPPTPEIVPLSRGGVEYWVAVAVADAGGTAVYTLRDVTTDRHLEQMRADIVAIVSHELRTPLTGVYGAAQTLLARYETLEDDQRRQFLAMIVEQSDRFGRILDEILLTSRLDVGEVQAETADVDAAAVVDAVTRRFGDADRARITVDVRPGALARADFERLAQVLTNLVDNALKYSSATVAVAAGAHDGAVRFTVADEGPGIPTAERERVFEKFFRLDPAQSRGVGGTGLGLYIARELTRRMDGRIGLVPRERGAMFFVDVPAAAPETGRP